MTRETATDRGISPDRLEWRIVNALLLVGIVTGAPLLAQEPQEFQEARDACGTRTVRHLFLREAIDLAHAHNPAYRRSVNELELTDVEGREFWLDFLPRPRVTLLRTDMQWNRATVGTDNFGNPIPNPELRMIQSARSDQFASLVWELDFGDWYRRRATRLRGDEREVLVDRAGNDLTSDVRSAFLDVQEIQESLRLEERLAEVRVANRKITERLFRLAQVDRPDLLAAELDHVDQQNRLQEIREELSTALLELRNVMGDPGLGSFEIAPAPLRIFDPDVLDLDALVERAIASGPDVRIASIGVQVAEGRVALNHADWLPTLEVRASTGRRQLSRESAGAFFRPIPDGEWDRAVGFTVNLPDLGTYFRRGAEDRRAEIEVRTAQNSLRQARLEIEEEVRGLIVELRSQHRRLEAQERRADLARERLDLQQGEYRLGQVNYLELQRGTETAADAERGALVARYGFERALIELERALGAPVRAAGE